MKMMRRKLAVVGVMQARGGESMSLEWSTLLFQLSVVNGRRQQFVSPQSGSHGEPLGAGGTSTQISQSVSVGGDGLDACVTEHSGLSCGLRGARRVFLGPSWANLGAVLGRSWAVLETFVGPSWRPAGSLRGHLGQFWGQPGLSGGLLEAPWRRLEAVRRDGKNHRTTMYVLPHILRWGSCY